MWCLADESGLIRAKSITKADMTHMKYYAERITAGVYRVVLSSMLQESETMPRSGMLYGSEEKAKINGAYEAGEKPSAPEKGIPIGTISVDVELLSDGSYDVWISTEGSSGAHYTGISADTIGNNVADLVESLAENYIEEEM